MSLCSSTRNEPNLSGFLPCVVCLEHQDEEPRGQRPWKCRQGCEVVLGVMLRQRYLASSYRFCNCDGGGGGDSKWRKSVQVGGMSMDCQECNDSVVPGSSDQPCVHKRPYGENDV